MFLFYSSRATCKRTILESQLANARGKMVGCMEELGYGK